MHPNVLFSCNSAPSVAYIKWQNDIKLSLDLINDPRNSFNFISLVDVVDSSILVRDLHNHWSLWRVQALDNHNSRNALVELTLNWESTTGISGQCKAQVLTPLDQFINGDVLSQDVTGAISEHSLQTMWTLRDQMCEQVARVLCTTRCPVILRQESSHTDPCTQPIKVPIDGNSYRRWSITNCRDLQGYISTWRSHTVSIVLGQLITPKLCPGLHQGDTRKDVAIIQTVPPLRSCSVVSTRAT